MASHDITMKRGKSEITAPRLNTGLDDTTSSGGRRSVFLTIPFYRTAFSSYGNRAKTNRPSVCTSKCGLFASTVRWQVCPDLQFLEYLGTKMGRASLLS